MDNDYENFLFADLFPFVSFNPEDFREAQQRLDARARSSADETLAVEDQLAA